MSALDIEGLLDSSVIAFNGWLWFAHVTNVKYPIELRRSM